MNGLVEGVAALGYGLASALVPVVNAEAYAAVAGQRGWHAVIAVLALALGQTAGKLLLFTSARRGTGRLAGRFARRNRSGRAARWAGRVRSALSHRRTAWPTVLASAAVGVPPLALVSIAAGAGTLRHRDFATACFLGRVVRFAVLALPAALLP